MTFFSRPGVQPPAPGLGDWRPVPRDFRKESVPARGWRYILATGVVLAAFGVRQALTVRFGPGLPPYITLYPSVMAVAYLGGFGPGLWATGVAVFLADYWILPPVGHFRVASPMDLLGLVLFVGMSLATSIAAGFYHRYRGKAAAYDREAALAPTLAELNEAQRLTHIGSWHWDAATDATTGSEELYRIFGFDAATRPSLTFQKKKGSWYPVEDWERVNAAMRATMATGIGYEIDLRVIRGSAFFWVTARGEAVRDADGRITGLCGTVQDITERKQAQEKLKESEEGFRTLADAIPHLCWMANADGWIFWYNQRWYDYTGTAPEQMAGWGWQSVHDPEVLPKVMQEWQASIDQGRPFEMVFPLLGRDGRFRPFLTRVMPVYAKDGKVSRWFGTHTDITEREQAAEALRQSQEWLSVTLASIGDGVVACDTEGRVTFLNPVAAALTGWSPAQAMGQPVARVFNIINEHSRRPAEDIVGRVLREKRVVGLGNHTALLGRDGRETPIADSAAPITDGQGRVTGVVLVFRDVTESKQAETERSATLDLLSLVNTCASTGELVSEVAAYFQKLSGCEAVGIRLRQGDDFPYAKSLGFPAGFLRAENQLCARDAEGRPIRDASGNPVMECLCGMVIGGRTDPGQPFFTRGGSFWTHSTTRLLPITTAAGPQTLIRNHCNHEGYESVALIPLVSGGQRLGLLQMNDRRENHFPLENIHLWERLASHVAVALAKSQAEQELRGSEAALKEAGRHKDEFLATLSHELRNPLAAITNSIYLLDQMEPANEHARGAQTVIGRQARQLSRLVDDLLDVTRISRNKIQLQFEGIDLVQVARRAVQDFRVAFEANGVRFDFLDPEGSVWIWADEARVTQMLGNLLVNAGKFTDPGGAVTLEIQTRNASAEVLVTDTGIGMDDAMLGQLFQPFAQADRSLDRSRGGLGLGLALAQGLAGLHGGTVSASSPGPGKGSRFKLTLPLVPPSENPPEEEPVQASPVQPRRILIIEDNLDAALTLSMLLEFSGHQVATAHSGSEGIAQAKAHRPEVILCDIGLPDTDGYTVARTLRAEPDLQPLCLVAMTGYGSEEDKRRASEAGFDHHLTKPGDPEVLQRLLAF